MPATHIAGSACSCHVTVPGPRIPTSTGMVPIVSQPARAAEGRAVIGTREAACEVRRLPDRIG
ncbi:hypothetical protein GCM10010492_27340 [Saccharothrix mutabilis subsp. mutabilis]|uniref:Uncharacterized protein n=1 Tax=Saccharothrix mutabilis subsp. mutabilis TaxID=66855 RepID=A0ABN0TQW5_9PSEU